MYVSLNCFFLSSVCVVVLSNTFLFHLETHSHTTRLSHLFKNVKKKKKMKLNYVSIAFSITHSRVLAWRILGTGEPGGLPSMGSHRVGHD